MDMASSEESRSGSKSALNAQVSSRFTIGELARHFGISLRTLRFYEDRGLLVPKREGTARFYGPREKAHLETILHLKQLGFTLTEIREMTADADKRPAEGPLQLRPDQISAQIAYLERQRRDIDSAISTLRDVQRNRETA